MAKNEVRIIGGKWRGRKLKFPDAKGLRPSQDRNRETLFNWLAGYLADAVCLDLFAGSGVLGFEALSRGAARVDLVELARPAQSALHNSKELLNAETARVHSRDALQFLRSCNTRYDLVFVDPPFDLDLGTPVLRTLINNDLLNEGALVYVEQSRRAAPCWDPQHWSTHRERAFGESRAVLLQPAIQAP